MKKIVFVFLFILLISFVLADVVPLVKYFDHSVNSHACLPSDEICVYQNVVGINSDYLGGAVGGVRILGISDLTNAHVEKFGKSNYGFGVYMIPTIFSSSVCEFTNKGENCSTGKTCGFSLSDETNAHLSSCNVFSNEIKFCCNPEVFSPVEKSEGIPDNCNIFSFEVQKKLVDSNILISFSCIENVDANLLIYTTQGEILGGPKMVSCGVESKNYSGFVLANPQVVGVKMYTSVCSVEKFVSLSKSNDFIIPDNNIFSVIFLLGLIGIIFIRNKN